MTGELRASAITSQLGIRLGDDGVPVLVAGRLDPGYAGEDDVHIVTVGWPRGADVAVTVYGTPAQLRDLAFGFAEAAAKAERGENDGVLRRPQ